MVDLEKLSSNDEGVYSFEAVEGGIKVTYNTGDREWTYLNVNLEGLTGYNRLVATIEGTAGEELMIKYNNAVEVREKFDAEGKMSFAHAKVDTINQLFIFAAPGKKNSTGSFVIKEMKLDYVHHLNASFPTNNQDYKLEEGKIKYTNCQGYMAVVIPVDQHYKTLNTFVIEFKATKDVKVLFKANDDGTLEQTLTTGEDGIIRYEKTVTEAKSMVLFVNPDGKTPLTGELEIVDFYICKK